MGSRTRVVKISQNRSKCPVIGSMFPHLCLHNKGTCNGNWNFQNHWWLLTGKVFLKLCNVTRQNCIHNYNVKIFSVINWTPDIEMWYKHPLNFISVCTWKRGYHHYILYTMQINANYVVWWWHHSVEIPIYG